MRFELNNMREVETGILDSYKRIKKNGILVDKNRFLFVEVSENDDPSTIMALSNLCADSKIAIVCVDFDYIFDSYLRDRLKQSFSDAFEINLYKIFDEHYSIICFGQFNDGFIINE